MKPKNSPKPANETRDLLNQNREPNDSFAGEKHQADINRIKVLELLAHKHALVEILQVLELNPANAPLQVLSYQRTIMLLFDKKMVHSGLQQIHNEICTLCANNVSNEQPTNK